MLDPYGTEAHRALLKRIQSRGTSLRILAACCAPLFFAVGYFVRERHPISGMVIEAVALAVSFGLILYLATCQRCPRCSGWIAIPQCPACGLKLEK
jgi:hypothetical protein